MTVGSPFTAESVTPVLTTDKATENDPTVVAAYPI